METRKQLIEIITNLTENVGLEEPLKDSSDLIRMGMNSIIFIRLVVEIEDKFGVIFEDDMLDYKKFSNLGELATYINSLRLK